MMLSFLDSWRTLHDKTFFCTIWSIIFRRPSRCSKRAFARAYDPGLEPMKLPISNMWNKVRVFDFDVSLSSDVFDFLPARRSLFKRVAPVRCDSVGEREFLRESA